MLLSLRCAFSKFIPSAEEIRRTTTHPAWDKEGNSFDHEPKRASALVNQALAAMKFGVIVKFY